MTTAHRRLKVRVKVVGQANAVGPSSIEGSFSKLIQWRRDVCGRACLQYENLDEQHKGLFKGVFAVAGARGDAGVLSCLLDSVKKHFATEEVRILAYYKTISFPQGLNCKKS